MKLVSYTFLGVFVFYIVSFIANNAFRGNAPIVSAIAILCSTVIICTLIIREAINNLKKS